MAEGFRIASAFVEVNLKDNTADDLKKLKAEIESGKPVEIPTKFKPPSDSDRKKQREEEEKQPPVEIPTKLKDPVDEAWKQKLQADLKAAAKSLNDIPINAETENFRREVSARIQEINKSLKAEIPMDVAEAATFREKIRAEAAAVGREVKAQLPTEFMKPAKAPLEESKKEQESAPPVKIPTKLEDPVNDAWKQKVNADLRAAARELAGIPVNADTEAFRRQVAERVQEVNRSLKADIPMDVAEAAAFREKIRAEVSAVEHSIKAKIDVEADSTPLQNVRRDAESAATSVGRVGSSGNSSGMQLGSAFKIGSIVLGAIPAGAAAAAAAIAAIGPAALGAGAALGAIGFAFSGVSAALKGHAADQNAAATASNNSASTQLSNAIAIRGAQQGITDAQKQQARVYSDSADSIAQAEQKVSDAQRSETMAQQALTDARRAAAQQIDDLNRRVQDMAVSEEGASLAVEAAQLRLKQVLANPLSTDLEQRQAAYEVKAAEQRLNDLQAQDERTRRQADEANAKGVEGDKAVVSAKNQVISATEGVQNAEQALTKAHVDAARQRADADEAVAKAQQNLADTLAQQAAAAGAAAGGISQFATAMAKLTPAGREFVNQLLSMKPLIDGLSATAQTAMLPGFTQMLRDSTPLFPIFNSGIQQMGTVFGDTARAAGQLFQSPVFQGQMQAAMNNAIPMFKGASDAALSLFQSFIQLGSVAGPVTTAIGDGIRTLAGGLGNFMSAIAPAMGPIGSMMTSLFNAVSGLLGPLGQLVAMIATSFAPVFKALEPVIADLANGLLLLLKPIIAALGPLLVTVAGALDSVLKALEPVLPVVGDLVAALGPVLGTIAEFIAQLLIGLAPVLKTIAEALKPVVESLGGALAQVLPPLADAFTHLVQALTPLIEPITQLIIQLLPPLADVLVRLFQALDPVWPSIQRLAETIAQGLVQAINELAPRMPQMIDDFMKILNAIIPILPQLIDLVGLIVQLVIPAIIAIDGVMMDMYLTIYGPIADAIKWLSDNIPAIWQHIKDEVRREVGQIRDVINWFSELPGKLGDWFGRAKDAATGKLGEMVDWVRGLPRRITDAVGDLGSTLWNSGRSLIDGLWRGFQSRVNDIKNNISDALGSIRNLFPHSPAKEGPFSGSGWVSYSGESIATAFAGGITAKSGDVLGATTSLMSSARASLGGGLSVGIGGDGASLGSPTGGVGPDTSPAGGGGVTIQNLTFNLQGIVDLQDPYSMDQASRKMVAQFRDAIRVVEGQYS